MVLRPDEIASKSNIEAEERTTGRVKQGASLALSAGLGTAAAATGIASKIAPFLNQYIPVDLAVRGISKISPKLGNILKKGQSMGMDINEGMEFIKRKMAEPEKKKQESKQAALKKFNEKKKKGKGVVDELSEQYQKHYGSPQWNMPPAQAKPGIQQQAQQKQQAVKQQTQKQNPQQAGRSDQELLAALQKILTM